MFFTAYALCSLRLFKLKPEGQKYKQKTSMRRYKTEIKILANPGLALSRFEQPRPADLLIVRYGESQSLA